MSFFQPGELSKRYYIFKILTVKKSILSKAYSVCIATLVTSASSAFGAPSDDPIGLDAKADDELNLQVMKAQANFKSIQNERNRSALVDALLERGFWADRSSKFRKALKDYRQSVELSRKLSSATPLAKSLMRRGNMHAIFGDLTRAESDYKSAIELCEKHNDLNLELIKSQTYCALARIESDRHDEKSEQQYLQSTIASCDRLIENQPSHDAFLCKCQACLMLGRLQQQQQQSNVNSTGYTDAIKACDAIIATDSANFLANLHKSKILTEIACTRGIQTGDNPDAEAILNEFAPANKSLQNLKPNNHFERFEADLARANYYLNLALTLYASRLPCEEQLEKASQTSQLLITENASDFRGFITHAFALELSAEIAARQGKSAEAEKLIKKALKTTAQAPRGSAKRTLHRFISETARKLNDGELAAM